MTDYLLVSVIMPLYNKKPYVERSIKSVINQTYPNWELIIVDDGSTDGSAYIVPQDDPRIKLFRQSTRGPGAARNKAAEMASGDYLAFIDADDHYYPFKLEREVEVLGNGQAEWMMSAYDFQLDGIITRRYIKDINNAEIKDGTKVFDDAINQLSVAGWPSDGIFIKKTLFERLCGFNESMRYNEITEFMIRCAVVQPKIIIGNIPLCLIVDVPGSLSHVSSSQIEHLKQMGESLYKLSQAHPKYSRYLKQRSDNLMISYAANRILNGEDALARKFLIEEYPYEKTRRWWKMWVGSWLPVRLLNILVPARKGLTS